MSDINSIDHIKYCHSEATKFFGSELMLLKEVLPLITDDRLSKAGVLLMSCGQTGTVILQLANQVDSFTSEAAMLARAFIEKITNFCYVGVCDEKEYRAFVLHPVYKHFHNTGELTMKDYLNGEAENTIASRKTKQDELRKSLIVKEALQIFSDRKPNLTWSKKNIGERIDIIEKSGKFLDVFFAINKMEYYSDASEALHGSLYGCTYNLGLFEPDFDHGNSEKLQMRLYHNATCVLLHMGMLIHEAFTLISYTDQIDQPWEHSYRNRNAALNLLIHVSGANPQKVNQKDDGKEI